MSLVQWLVASISLKRVGPVSNRTASRTPSSLQWLVVHLVAVFFMCVYFSLLIVICLSTVM